MDPGHDEPVAGSSKDADQVSEQSAQRTAATPTLFRCDKCLDKFTSEEELKQHVGSPACEKPYRCEICPRVFYWKENLVHHKQMYYDQWRCCLCNKHFPPNSICGYALHFRYHRRPKEYFCLRCHRAFARPYLLRQHQKEHYPDPPAPLTCEFCRERFECTLELEAHRRLRHPQPAPDPSRGPNRSFQLASGPPRYYSPGRARGRRI